MIVFAFLVAITAMDDGKLGDYGSFRLPSPRRVVHVFEPESTFEGVWQLVAANREGKTVTPSPRRITVEVFAEGQWAHWKDVVDGRFITSYQRDPGKGFHRIKKHTVEQHGAGYMQVRGSRQAGLYLLEGDKMTFCFSEVSLTDMEPGPDRTIEVFRRVRDAEQVAFLQGRWELVSINLDGKARTASPTVLVVNQTGQWTEEIDGKPIAWTVKRGEGIPWPSIQFERPNPIGGMPIRWKGIHRREGETLTITFGGGVMDGLEPGPGRRVEVYHRLPEGKGGTK